MSSHEGIGDPCHATWGEEVVTRAEELDALATWVCAERRNPKPVAEEFRKSIEEHLHAARKTAHGKFTGRRLSRWWMKVRSAWGGSSIERAAGNLEAVEAHILRLAPDNYVRGELPSIRAYVARYLPKDDPRREGIEELAQAQAQAHSPLKRRVRPVDREAIIAAYHAASSQKRRELMRVRSFRNVLLVAALVLSLVAVGLGVLGFLRPDTIPLCFEPESGGVEKVVCPTAETDVAEGDDIDDVIKETVSGWDMTIVMITGLIAAAVATAFALRGIRGTSTPYSLPVALALLKLPTGALTAVVGLVLMRGGFVPGLSALDSSAQILSWAVVFGYAQQLFTRLVDEQAHAVLEDVGGRGAAGDRPTSSAATPATAP